MLTIESQRGIESKHTIHPNSSQSSFTTSRAAQYQSIMTVTGIRAVEHHAFQLYVQRKLHLLTCYIYSHVNMDSKLLLFYSTRPILTFA